MPPAIVAAVAAVATVAVKVYVTSQILAAILLVAISVAATALMKKPNRSYNQGQEIRLKLDASMPRQVALGVTGTGGSLVWAFTYTDNSKKPNRYLVRIIQLSDLPINDILEVREGKNILTFTGNYYTGFASCNEHKTKKGAAAMWMRVYKGSATATADSDLQTWSGGQWTSAHKGVNCAYVILKYDNNPDAFPSGEPQLTFGLEGAKLYDERYDTTVGGSGAQRVDDPATWAFSKNASVITANVLRGLFSAGVLLYGANAEARDLDTQMLFSAHNTCDQAIPASGGTVPRYVAGLMATSADPTSVALLDLQAAFDGRIIDRGGAITLRPGASHTPVFNLTDDDVVWSEQKSWQPRSTLSEITNCITGTYIEPSEGFIEKPFPPIRNAAWEAEDGGERFTTNIAFRAIYQREQAQRVTKRVGDAGRYQGTVAFALPIWGIEMEQGDWFTMTSARWGFTTKYFEAATVDIVMGDTLMLAVTGREVSPSFSSWDYAVDEKPRGDTQWNSPNYDLVNPDFSVSQYHTLDMASYHEVFGLNVQLYNIPDGFAAKQVEIQVALTADKANPISTDVTTAQNQIFTILGLEPATNYSVRIRATDGQRYADYSAWVDVATAASTNPLPADLAQLDADTVTALADIAALQSQAATIESDILAAEGDIATLYSLTSTQGADIATNATAISNNVGDIANLTVEVRTYSPNLIPNGGFEDGLTSWTQSVGVWGTADVTTAVYANHAYINASDNGGNIPANAQLQSEWIPVSAGLQYTLSADIRANIPSGSVFVDAAFYAADKTTLLLDGADIVVPFGAEFFPTGPGRNANVQTYTAPASAAWARVRITGPATTVTGQIAAKEVKFQLGDKATAFTNESSVTQTFKAINSLGIDVATLETTVATQGASIVTNATAISTLDSNLASLTSVVSAGTGNYLNANAFFSDYPTTPGRPTYWSPWQTASDPVRVAGEQPGSYAVRDTTSAGAEQGDQQDGVAGLANINPSQFLVLEADVRLDSGTLQGAGVHISFRDSGGNGLGSKNINFYTEPDSTGAAVGAGTVGKVYRFRELVQANATAVDHAILYRLTGWTGFGTIAAKTLTWFKCGVRPATQEEIAAGVALPSVQATVTSHTSAIATNTGNITTAFARAALTLDVNNYVTGWEINNNGTTSNFKIRADRFVLANGTGVPFEVIGSQVYMKNVLIRNAQIDNLAVGTSNIQDFAVTRPYSYFTSAYTVPALGAWETVAQLSVPVSAGETVDILAALHNGDIFGTGDPYMVGYVRLLRNVTILVSPFGISSTHDTIALSDSPPTGTNTYYLQVFRSTNVGGNDGVWNRYIGIRKFSK